MDIKRILPYALGLITTISIFVGLFTINQHNFIQAFYGTFSFFGGNGSAEDIQSSFLLSFSAITVPITVFMAIILFFIDRLKKWWFFSFVAKDQKMIFGLGMRSNYYFENKECQ